MPAKAKASKGASSLFTAGAGFLKGKGKGKAKKGGKKKSPLKAGGPRGRQALTEKA